MYIAILSTKFRKLYMKQIFQAVINLSITNFVIRIMTISWWLDISNVLNIFYKTVEKKQQIVKTLFQTLFA